MSRVGLTRRQVGAGLLGAAAIATTGPYSRAAAQADFAGPWRDLADLTLQAQRLGVSVPRMSLGPESTSGDYDRVMPAYVDLIDSLDAAAAEGAPAGTDAIRDKASELLRTLRNAERLPREDPAVAPSAGPSAAPPTYDQVAANYRKLFSTCKISEAKRSEVQWYASKVADQKRRGQYDAVFEQICVPWYFVAIVHGMEASFDFNAHLHNGDPLRARTVQIPKARPATWNPPTDWVSSAVDAMKYDKFADLNDWDLARMLYRWEAYNGWRSRMLHGINTPYLWSFSNHYSKGKYVADNVWDANAVSKQCGAAVMLKALVEQGALAPPA